MQSEDRDEWEPSMASEIMNFIKRKSWKSVPRSKANASGQTIIKTKWVFKKKEEQDGSTRYKSQMVSKGFQQKPGIDYTESFSPVANDTSVRAAICLALFNTDWTVEVIDIEAAFLEGTLAESAFIERPDGMVELGFITQEEAQTTVGELLKSMYGNINTALRFFKEYVKHMILPLMGMVQNFADPCAFVKIHEGKTVLIVTTHIDGTELCGMKAWIEWFKSNVKQRFNYMDMGKLMRYLGIWY
jgi:hypothetical protein